jgi:Protein of unknown function (DUF1759)/Putative peptidase (DUF1758)
MLQQERLSDVAKMHYLLDNLESKPKSVIVHLQISGQNYENAVKLLQDRYQNQRKTETSYIETILYMPSLQSRTSDSVIKMHDTIKECIVNLENLGDSIKHCSRILTIIILEKFDYDTSRIFEEGLVVPRQVPEITYVLEFLSRRFIALDSMKNNKKPFQSYNDTKRDKRQVHITSKASCPQCKDKHALKNCKTFLGWSISDRKNFANSQNICRRCLDHKFEKKCINNSRCRKCNGVHHILSSSEKTTNHFASANGKSPVQTVTCLPTAQIRVKDHQGELHILRAMVDQESQSTFITEKAAQMLKLKRRKVNIQILGVGNIKAASIKHVVNLLVQPRFGSNQTHIMEANLTKNLTGTHPETKLGNPRKYFEKVTMADPEFFKPGNIDVIIGADYFPEILLSEMKKKETCILQETTLGWIVSGRMPTIKNEFINQIHTLISQTEIKDLNEQLIFFSDVEKFREITPTSDIIEQRFSKDVTRDVKGRYTVKIPMIESGQLGNSRDQALTRFYQMEGKLKKNPQVYEPYKNFML